MKQKIRKEILEERNSLTSEDIIRKSSIIKEKLSSLPEYENSKVICFYVSFGSEVNTYDMIKESIKNGKTVCVPVVKNAHLILSLISSFNDLNKKNKYGILEPSIIKKIEKNNVDLIIVPAVAFDKEGYRVGYGKGYYDRLLSGYKGKKIGLAFKLQIVDKIPIKEHDVKVDKIITE